MIGEKSLENPTDCFTRDVEDQIFNSKTNYYQAIENADGVPFQLIFGPNVGEGYYLHIGKGILQLLGIPPEELSEKNFNEMIVEIIPSQINIPVELSVLREKFVKGDLKKYKAEVLVRLPDGENRWILDTSLPLINEKTGKVVGAYGILFDRNEQKLTVETLERAKEMAMESDKFKSAFLRTISHEIRTPLNAIVGFSTLLNEPEKTHGERQEIMNNLFRSTDHLLEIITNIVEISNVESNAVKVRKSVISLSATLTRIYDRFSIKALEKSISLRLTSAQDVKDVSLFTDGYKLFQILTYLLDNAIKFTEKGEVEFGFSLNDNTIKFYVSDSGIGIPAGDQQSVFNRFYQAESSSTRRYDGTGLGLSISKAYIELLGGEIWFTSKTGEGSVFYFTLPLEREVE